MTIPAIPVRTRWRAGVVAAAGLLMCAVDPIYGLGTVAIALVIWALLELVDHAPDAEELWPSGIEDDPEWTARRDLP